MPIKHYTIYGINKEFNTENYYYNVSAKEQAKLDADRLINNERMNLLRKQGKGSI